MPVSNAVIHWQLVHTLARRCLSPAIADNREVLSTFCCRLHFTSSSRRSRLANSSSCIQHIL